MVRTLDEAIAHAREKAEINRTLLDSDELVQKSYDAYFNRRKCEKCAEENEQLAEWLEELKAYRKNKEEYNGGWILCGERLPKEKDGVVLIYEVNGKVGTGRYSEFSNQWYIGDMCAIGGSKVIAWQPLPQPYKESTDEQL